MLWVQNFVYKWFLNTSLMVVAFIECLSEFLGMQFLQGKNNLEYSSRNVSKLADLRFSDL